MGLFSFIGWVIGLIFAFVFDRINDIFVWVIPSYMTVYVIKEQKTELYSNYLCFWVILALILGIEHVTFYLFHYITFYRTIRLLFVIWLQVDYSSNATIIFEKLKPLIRKDHEEIIEKALNSVTEKLDEHGGKIKEKASNQFWQIIHQNYELIKDSLFSALTTVSNKAVDLTDTNSMSQAQPNANNKDILNGEQDDDRKDKEEDTVPEKKETIVKKES